jgi:hypothetical protein
MSNKKYQVYLTEDEKQALKALIHKGVAPARQIQRAHVLLKADVSEGQGWRDKDIRAFLDLGPHTVRRIRRRCFEVGALATVQRKPPERQYVSRLDGEQEAHLIALACSAPPEGQARWTLRLLAERLVALAVVERVSHETVRQVLKKRT